jgi:hypothetical protein
MANFWVSSHFQRWLFDEGTTEYAWMERASRSDAHCALCFHFIQRTRVPLSLFFLALPPDKV